MLLVEFADSVRTNTGSNDHFPCRVQRSGELGLFSSMSSRLFGDKQTGSFNYQVAAKSDLYLSVVIGVYFYRKMNPDNSRTTNLESPRLTSKGQML